MFEEVLSDLCLIYHFCTALYFILLIKSQLALLAIPVQQIRKKTSMKNTFCYENVTNHIIFKIKL